LGTNYWILIIFLNVLSRIWTSNKLHAFRWRLSEWDRTYLQRGRFFPRFY